MTNKTRWVIEGVADADRQVIKAYAELHGYTVAEVIAMLAAPLHEKALQLRSWQRAVAAAETGLDQVAS